MTIAGYRIRYADGSIRQNTGVRGWRQLPTADIVASCVFYTEQWRPQSGTARPGRDCILRANWLWVEATGALAWGDSVPDGIDSRDARRLAIGDMDRTPLYWTIANAAQADWTVPT